MKIDMEYSILPAFTAVGIEGSTKEGDGFIAKLWSAANSRFSEISDGVLLNADGQPDGIWGLMSDFSRSFLPWENGFKEGLYLAGAPCRPDYIPPEGFSKWTVPAYEYVYIPAESEKSFSLGLELLKNSRHSLAGAAFERYVGKNCYLYYPIKRL